MPSRRERSLIVRCAVEEVGARRLAVGVRVPPQAADHRRAASVGAGAGR